MKRSRHRGRGRPVPSWWGWPVTAVGLSLAVLGGWLAIVGGPAVGSAVRLPGGDRSAEPGVTAKPRPPKAPASQGTTPASTPPPAKSRAGSPTAIEIPRLDISARVAPIRVRTGSLTPPSNPRVIGWWADGALPGATKGSVVLTGHKVSGGGGAFDELGRLVPGDVVTVSTARGRHQYAVSGVTTYRKQSLAKHAAEVFDQRIAGRLVLITCEDWNGSVFLSNAVVLADPVR